MSFQNLPNHARVWIYQSNRKLNNDEVQWLEKEAKEFVSTWAAHGKTLAADVEVLHNYFLIFMVDEAQEKASGCSIDASVNFVRSAQEHLKNDFFDRMHITYRLDSNSTVESADKEEFEKLLAQEIVNDDTLVYNNLVKTKAEWLSEWEIPLSKSWHANFFSKV